MRSFYQLMLERGYANIQLDRKLLSYSQMPTHKWHKLIRGSAWGLAGLAFLLNILAVAALVTPQISINIARDLCCVVIIMGVCGIFLVGIDEFLISQTRNEKIKNLITTELFENVEKLKFYISQAKLDNTLPPRFFDPQTYAPMINSLYNKKLFHQELHNFLNDYWGVMYEKTHHKQQEVLSIFLGNLNKKQKLNDSNHNIPNSNDDHNNSSVSEHLPKQLSVNYINREKLQKKSFSSRFANAFNKVFNNDFDNAFNNLTSSSLSSAEIASNCSNNDDLCKELSSEHKEKIKEKIKEKNKQIAAQIWEAQYLYTLNHYLTNNLPANFSGSTNIFSLGQDFLEKDKHDKVIKEETERLDVDISDKPDHEHRIINKAKFLYLNSNSRA